MINEINDVSATPRFVGAMDSGRIAESRGHNVSGFGVASFGDIPLTRQQEPPKKPTTKVRKWRKIASKVGRFSSRAAVGSLLASVGAAFLAPTLMTPLVVATAAFAVPTWIAMMFLIATNPR